MLRVAAKHGVDASDKEIVQCIAALLLGSAVEEQN